MDRCRIATREETRHLAVLVGMGTSSGRRLVLVAADERAAALGAQVGACGRARDAHGFTQSASWLFSTEPCTHQFPALAPHALKLVHLFPMYWYVP